MDLPVESMSPDDLKYIIPRSNRKPPRSPSRRTPHKSWFLNAADWVERGMQADGHHTWGYVIYRTTYSSDDDWAEVLRMLRATMERTYYRCNGHDILDLSTLTVFSDPAQFDGADTTAIRAHFRQWAETASQTEQQPPSQDASISGPGGKGQVRIGRSPRYHLCIQVDEAALRSVVHEAPAAPRLLKKGWVKLIKKEWLPWDEDPPPAVGQRIRIRGSRLRA